MEANGITERLLEEFNPASLFKNLNKKLGKGQYIKAFIY